MPARDLLHAVRRHGVIAQQRIGIYRDAYHLRLAEALASNYPAIALYLGETDFSVLAQAYSDCASLPPRVDPLVRRQAWSVPALAVAVVVESGAARTGPL